MKLVCSARVPSPGMNGMYFHGCRKPVTTTSVGKNYCAVHDPSYVARKEKSREAKWKADQRRSNYDHLLRAWAFDCADVLNKIAFASASDGPILIAEAQRLLAKQPKEPKP